MWHGKPRSRASRKALSLVLRQQYWPRRRIPIASAGISVSQFFGAWNLHLEAKSHSSSSTDLKSLGTHWSSPPSKGQWHEDTRPSTASGVRHLQPPSTPSTWLPSQASNGDGWQKAQRHPALLSWVVTVPRGPIKPVLCLWAVEAGVPGALPLHTLSLHQLLPDSPHNVGISCSIFLMKVEHQNLSGVDTWRLK